MCYRQLQQLFTNINKCHKNELQKTLKGLLNNKKKDPEFESYVTFF